MSKLTKLITKPRLFFRDAKINRSNTEPSKQVAKKNIPAQKKVEIKRRIIFFFVTANNSEYDTYSYNKEYSSNDSNEFYIKFRASASLKRYICFLSHNLSPLKLLIYVLKRQNMHNYGTLRNKIFQEKY